MQEYIDSYSEGFEKGRDIGYALGYKDAEDIYEYRISKYWAELQTLNARISYLEKLEIKKEETEDE
jgi:flagellar biosynthesis/type III secretory pathway protein FliH